MKDEIERALEPLHGEPLSDMWRLGGLQAFEFGIQRPAKNRRGQDITCADLRLHIACFWRITENEVEILASADFGPNKSRRDEKAKPFYESLETDPPVVEAIEADDTGGFVLQMTSDFTLTVRPDEINEEPDSEQWRFLPKDKRTNHFVVTAQGIER